MKLSKSLLNQKHENNSVPENYWSAVKNEGYGNTFPAVETWLNRVTDNKPKKERKFASMKNYFAVNKKRLAYAFIVLALVVVACNMPVTQHETVGHMLTWTADKKNSDAASHINNLGWLKNVQLNVTESNTGGKTEVQYSAMLPDASTEQLHAYIRDLEKINGVSSVKLFPLNEDIKRPLYSAALFNFFKVDINAHNLTDKEVEEQITKQLKEGGIENPNIEVKTDEQGRRMIRMKVEDTDLKDGKSFEVRVHDGKNEEVLKRMKFHSDRDFKGRTDDEIRKIIKEDLKDEDIKESDIQIIRENGDVKVKVIKEVEK
jgi:hypothetical protein